MTTTRKKRIITIESWQRTVIRPDAPQTIKIWCEFCQAEVEMITTELAARILKVSVREIFRRIEKGNLHFFEAETGGVFICQSPLE